MRALPRLYDPLMEVPERAGLRALRHRTVGGVSGDVLELGAGTGRNIPLYGPAVEHLTLTEPDVEMLQQARGRAREAPFPTTPLVAPAEALPFEDGVFDAVVATLVMCTVEDPVRSLSEARRVLKDGGELRLAEHVRVEREPFGRAQELATPVWKHLAGGCHLDRDTLAHVKEAGFEVQGVERHLGGLVLGISARRPE